MAAAFVNNINNIRQQQEGEGVKSTVNKCLPNYQRRAHLGIYVWVHLGSDLLFYLIIYYFTFYTCFLKYINFNFNLFLMFYNFLTPFIVF